jgi:pilus assembly protein CpaF
MQEIFSFQQTQIDPEGNVKGRFKFHGVRPKFMEKFKMVGIPVSQNLFDPSNYVEV